MHPTALVSDVHYRMSLALVRDLAQAGADVVTCERASLRSPATPPLGGLSKYAVRHVWLPDQTYGDSLLSLCQELAEACGAPPALLPVGASTLALLAGQQERFREACGLCVPTPGQLDLLNDKDAVLRLAQELEIPRPGSFFREPGEPVEQFLNRVDLPCVVKPACGERLGLSARERYRVARTVSQLAEAFAHFQNLGGQDPLVQSYLPGAGLGCSLIAQEGRVLGCICHQRLREYPVSGGPSSCCQAVQRPDLEDYAARLMARTGYSGPCMVEFKEDGRSRPRILEVNPRIWGSFPLTRASRSGLSLLWMQASLGGAVEAPPAPQPRKMVFALSDLLAGLGYLRQGQPGRALGALADICSPWVRDGVFEWRDPRPGLAYLRAALSKRNA